LLTVPSLNLRNCESRFASTTSRPELFRRNIFARAGTVKSRFEKPEYGGLMSAAPIERKEEARNSLTLIDVHGNLSRVKNLRILLVVVLSSVVCLSVFLGQDRPLKPTPTQIPFDPDAFLRENPRKAIAAPKATPSSKPLSTVPRVRLPTRPATLSERLDDLEEKLSDLDLKLDETISKLDEIISKLDEMDTKVDKLEDVETKLDEIEKKVDGLEK